MELQRSSREVPKVRSPGVDVSGVPRHWFGGNVVATHVANGVNLLFPAGERFFVRSVHHYLDRIDDEHLRARVKGFFSRSTSPGGMPGPRSATSTCTSSPRRVALTSSGGRP